MPFRPLRRALGASLACLALLCSTASAAAPGLSVLGDAGGQEPNWAAQVLPGGGEKWIFMPIGWSLLEQREGTKPHESPNDAVLGDVDLRIDKYVAAGFKVMGVLTTAPDWAHPGHSGPNYPPDDAHFDDYAAFAAYMANRYSGKVAAWQVWNEPDDGVFWLGGPEPARYTNLLMRAAGAIRGADPAAMVVAGGLVGNDYDFLQKVYANGGGNSFDAVGTHTGTACLTKDPGYYSRDIDGPYKGRINRYMFSAYREVHQQMLANGQDKPILMEIGWSTAAGQECNVGSKTGPAGVTTAEQAKFLTQAYQCLAADPYVRAAAWFSLQDSSSAYTGYDSRMGLVDSAGAHRPSWDAMSAVGTQGASAIPCGGKVDVDKPAATIDMPDQYVTRVTVAGSATDPTTPIRKIELWVDGSRVEGANSDGGTYSLDWFGSSKLSKGKHTFELRAYDEAFNMATASKVVEKVDASQLARVAVPRVAFKAKRLKGRRIRVTARILRALTGAYTGTPNGKLRVFAEIRRGKKWKPYSRFTKGISKPIKFTIPKRAKGTWRVWGRVAVDPPYKVVRTKYFKFRMR